MINIHGRVPNPVAWILGILIIGCIIFSLYITNRKKEIPPVPEANLKALSVQKVKTKPLVRAMNRHEVEELAEQVGLPREKFLLIVEKESGFDADAKNYNCHYYIRGIQHSKSCEKGHENEAWSVDCGIVQLNFRGKVCPKESKDIHYSIKEAKKRYNFFYDRKGDGLLAWNSYKHYKIDRL